MSLARPGLRARAGLFQICLAGALWGTGGLAVEVVRDHAPLSPLTISAYRTGIAALVLLVAALLLRRLGDVRRLLRERPGLTCLVGLCTAAYQALYFASVVAVGVTVSTVVSLGLAPLLLAGRDAVRRRALPSPREALPVVAALVGLVLVSGTAGHGDTGPEPVLGVVLAIASGTAYAAATAWGEGLARSTDPVVLTTATTSVGALGLVPVALLGGGPYVTADPEAVATLLYLGVLTFALAYALLYAGLRTTSSSAAVVATLVEPVTAGLVAVAFLGERLGAPGVVGMVLVLVAIATLNAPPAPAAGPVRARPRGWTRGRRAGARD
ncbi:DMT family transporter [Nocardioides sp. C4-1]|uniref:DMT family transporter n=1 Tax=Nocardioides sp. C4-1 TaxID=3151851 RepID=UPI003263FCC9